MLSLPRWCAALVATLLTITSLQSESALADAHARREFMRRAGLCMLGFAGLHIASSDVQNGIQSNSALPLEILTQKIVSDLSGRGAVTTKAESLQVYEDSRWAIWNSIQQRLQETSRDEEQVTLNLTVAVPLNAEATQFLVTRPNLLISVDGHDIDTPRGRERLVQSIKFAGGAEQLRFEVVEQLPSDDSNLIVVPAR